MLFFQTDISLFGNAFRHQGVFLLWHLLIFYLLSTKLLLPKFPYWLPLLLLTIHLLLAFSIGTTITNRSIGTLGEPNALAASAIFLWPFILSFDKKQRYRTISLILGIFLTGILIFLSGSRSGMLALFVQLSFLSLLAIKRIPFQISILISFLFLLLTFITPFVTKQNPYENRVEVWKIAFLGGFERPVLGGGFGNIEKLFHTSAVRINLPIQYYYVDSSHNVFLDYWFQGGFIGLLLLLLITFQCIRNFTIQKNIRGITLLLGLLTVMSFNPVSVVTLVAFWWLLGSSNQPPSTHKNRSA